MQKKVWIFIFSLVFIFTSPLYSADQISDTSVSEVVKQFSQEIDCKPDSKDPKKAWCCVTQIEKGEFVPPNKEQSYIGLSMEWIPTVKISESLAKSLQLGILHLGSKEARVTTLKPSNEQEKKELTELRNTIERNLQGENQTIQISPVLSSFLKSEIQKPKHPFTLAKGGAYFKGVHPSKIIKVKNQTGEVYLVLEQAEGGFFVSLFPIRNY